MKKTLALLLALATILTISLTACGKDDTQDPEDPGDEIIETPPVDDPKDSGNEPDDSQSEDTGKDDPVTPPVTEFEAKNDTIYILAPGANIRFEASKKSKVFAQAMYGKELKRTGTNGEWNRIELNGVTVYIQANLTTSDKNELTFNDLEPKTVYVNVDTQMNLRTTPLYFDGYIDNLFLVDGEGLPRGTELTLTGVNVKGNWSRVEYDGKTYYCRPNNISETVPSDTPIDGPGFSG